MATSLQLALPEELLDHIISFLSSPDMARLCCTSKSMNRLAFPRLYTHIILANNRDRKNYRYLRPLTLLMLTSEQHANFVHSLVLDEFSINSEEFPIMPFKGAYPYTNAEIKDHLQSSRLLPWPEHELLEELIRKHEPRTVENEDSWLYDVLNGDTDTPIIALLLHQLPNLRRLQLATGLRVGPGIYPTDSYCHLIFLNSMTPSNPPLFLSLTELLIHGRSDYCSPEFYVPGSHFATALALPSLRHLYGHQITSRVYHWNNNHMTSYGQQHWHGSTLDRSLYSAHIETLEFRNSLVDGDQLKRWLKICAPSSLRSFTYEIHTDSRYNYIVPAQSILDALEPHIATLGVLSITLSSLPLTAAFCIPYLCNPFPILGYFLTLTKLKLDAQLLWGLASIFNPPTDPAEINTLHAKLWQSLPASLEEFQLVCNHDFVIIRPNSDNIQHEYHQDWRFIRDHLGVSFAELATNRGEACPKLTKVVLEAAIHLWPDVCIGSILSGLEFLESFGVECWLRITSPCISYTDPEYPPAQRGWGWDEMIHFDTCMFNADSTLASIPLNRSGDLRVVEMLQSLRREEIELAERAQSDTRRLILRNCGVAFMGVPAEWCRGDKAYLKELEDILIESDAEI